MKLLVIFVNVVNPKQARGGRILTQAGSSLRCAETVSSRKLKLCDFYYILIGFNCEYKPVFFNQFNGYFPMAE